MNDRLDQEAIESLRKAGWNVEHDVDRFLDWQQQSYSMYVEARQWERKARDWRRIALALIGLVVGLFISDFII